jgi:betaine reductase
MADIPAVAGMAPDNPGVLASEGWAYIMPTGSTVVAMDPALKKLTQLATVLGSGEQVGPPEQAGYLTLQRRVNQLVAQTGAERAIAAALSLIGGGAVTEIEPSHIDLIAADPIADVSKATIALVTESGCVPRGNPDGFRTHDARSWHRYPIGNLERLDGEGFEPIHAGYDGRFAADNPNRIVPLDAARSMERQGDVGHIHDELFTTTGNNTSVAMAVNFGQEIAEALLSAGVAAAVFTAT